MPFLSTHTSEMSCISTETLGNDRLFVWAQLVWKSCRCLHGHHSTCLFLHSFFAAFFLLPSSSPPSYTNGNRLTFPNAFASDVTENRGSNANSNSADVTFGRVCFEYLLKCEIWNWLPANFHCRIQFASNSIYSICVRVSFCIKSAANGWEKKLFA